jgi:hypothetical protein
MKSWTGLPALPRRPAGEGARFRALGAALATCIVLLGFKALIPHVESGKIPAWKESKGTRVERPFEWAQVRFSPLVSRKVGEVVLSDRAMPTKCLGRTKDMCAGYLGDGVGICCFQMFSLHLLNVDSLIAPYFHLFLPKLHITGLCHLSISRRNVTVQFPKLSQKRALFTYVLNV